MKYILPLLIVIVFSCKKNTPIVAPKQIDSTNFYSYSQILANLSIQVGRSYKLSKYYDSLHLYDDDTIIFNEGSTVTEINYQTSLGDIYTYTVKALTYPVDMRYDSMGIYTMNYPEDRYSVGNGDYLLARYIHPNKPTTVAWLKKESDCVAIGLGVQKLLRMSELP